MLWWKAPRARRSGIMLVAVCGAGLLGLVVAHLWRRASGVTPASVRDRIDEASWESFPASDPPGWIPDHV